MALNVRSTSSRTGVPGILIVAPAFTLRKFKSLMLTPPLNVAVPPMLFASPKSMSVEISLAVTANAPVVVIVPVCEISSDITVKAPSDIPSDTNASLVAALMSINMVTVEVPNTLTLFPASFDVVTRTVLMAIPASSIKIADVPVPVISEPASRSTVNTCPPPSVRPHVPPPVMAIVKFSGPVSSDSKFNNPPAKLTSNAKSKRSSNSSVNGAISVRVGMLWS